MKVEFTSHALDRAAERVPHLGLKAIAREIAAAIEDGRISRDPPTWRMQNLNGRRRGIEFAWSADRARIYVLAGRRPDFVTLASIVLGARVAA